MQKDGPLGWVLRGQNKAFKASMLSAPSSTATYFRKVYNVLACLPLLGFLWAYSFWPTARLFGSYPLQGRGFFGKDPEKVGFPEYHEFLSGGVLPAVFLMQLMNLVILVVCSTLGLVVETDFSIRNMSHASIALVLGTLVGMPLFLSLDPGGYWFWFFD
jgi:ABC-type sugar transport system permease subunit